ncbi:MAG: porin [Bacteroidales bacterium]|nr:porin [Bacteroidales bacterium]
MKKHLTALSAGLLVASAAFSQETDIVSVGIDARVDFQHESIDGHTDNSNSGFEGKYLMLRVDGEIIPGLTYSWRQRFNKTTFDSNFFDSTDWLYLDYAIDRWHFQAGKEIVMIGGYEYDRNPKDLYSCSVFLNNIPCYDMGVSAGFDVTSNDRLSFQVTQSPFFTRENRNMYSYNLMWSGHHGIYESLFSANMIEYAKGRYINYIALGNKFSFDKFVLELDYMNRAASGQAFFFKDCTVMGELAYNPTDRWRVHVKGTYDRNASHTDKDYTVYAGTSLKMVGGGVEFYPLLHRRHTLRLHANLYYAWGHNTNTADVMQDKSLFVSAGLTWHFNAFSLKHK